MKLNVLIACEESQAECLAFRQLGHNAFSCDIQPCRRGGAPQWHILGDVSDLLAGKTDFKTMDGTEHHLSIWNLIIAHPPCTYICKVSAVRMWKNGEIDPERFSKMVDAVVFFRKCLNARAHYVAVENPLPMARAMLPKPTFYLQPSWFGHPWTKKTLYWTRNLPPIMPENEVANPKSFVMNRRGIYRSRTFPGIAQAIARQWSEYILGDMKLHPR